MKSSFDTSTKFLIENNQNATILESPRDEIGLMANLPTYWKPIVEANESERVALTIKMWQDNFATEFSLLIQAFKNQLIDVFILKRPEGYSLLYVIKGVDDVYYYEGPNPNDSKVSDSLQSFWPNLPDYLGKFYAEIHDGWYFIPGNSLGLIRSRNITVLEDDEWGILDDIDVSFDLSKTAAFFYNGASGYLCLNFEAVSAKGILWWSDKEPSIDINFEDFLDEWLTIGVEN